MKNLTTLFCIVTIIISSTLIAQKDTKAVYAIYLEKENGAGLPASFKVKGIFV